MNFEVWAIYILPVSNIHVSVLPDKKCQSYMLLVIWVYKMYMYLFYVTKNVCVTYWWYGYMYVNCKSGHYLMLHIYVSVLWDKNLYVIYIGDIAMVSGHLGTRYWIIKIIWLNLKTYLIFFTCRRCLYIFLCGFF